jgi:tetratricopeptide (TPR) repeat protein
MKPNILRLISAAGIILILAGCATAPVTYAPLEQDIMSKQQSPPDDKAWIYILLKPELPRWFSYEIYNSKGQVATLTKTAFIRWEVPEGALVVRNGTSVMLSCPFDAVCVKAGQKQYYSFETLWDDVAHIGRVSRLLTPLAEAQALAMLSSQRMSQNASYDQDIRSTALPPRISNSDIGDSLLYEGRAKATSGLHKEAAHDFSRALQSGTREPAYTLLLRGRSLLMLNKDAEATEDLESAKKMVPTLGLTIQFMKAGVYDQSGNRKKALEQYRLFQQQLEQLPLEQVSRDLERTSGTRISAAMPFRIPTLADQWPIVKIPGLDIPADVRKAQTVVQQRIRILEAETQ